MTTRPIVFPLSTDFFEGGAGLSSEGETNLVGILNQLGASSGLGSTQNAQAWNGSPLTFTLLEVGTRSWPVYAQCIWHDLER
jgi:hypothetical protein